MTPSADSGAAILLTLQLAAITTLFLLLLATPLAWWLARTSSRWRGVIIALITLPLVLPPTVLGFYILLTLGPDGWIGNLTQSLGLGLLSFSFTGLVIGSVFFSLPFAVYPILYAFEMLGRRPLEVATTLRAKPLDAFFSVALPLAKPGLLTASVLIFAHPVGAFGVVRMIGGDIPGETRVIATQIFGYVEAMEYEAAHRLAALMVAFSFVMLMALTRLRRRAGAALP